MATTSAHGVDKYGKGYRVRIRFPGQPRHAKCGFPTEQAATRYALEMIELRDKGLNPTSAPPAQAEPTLGEVAADLLQRKQTTVSRRTRRRLSARGVEHWQRQLRPWLDPEGEFARLPLSWLRVDLVQAWLLLREPQAPAQAKYELEGLKAALRHAEACGHGRHLDSQLFAITPVTVERRERRALTPDQALFLAERTPAHARRLVLWLASTGMRCGEAFTLTDQRLSLQNLNAHIPAEFCKERRAKDIPLTMQEASEARHQLLERAPGTALVFPNKQGRAWNRSSFNHLVWQPACQRAAADWRTLHRLPDTEPTPFCGLVPHDLRSTAATIMRDAGMSREDAAARLGHGDGGKLLDDLYDKGSRSSRVRASLDRCAPGGLLNTQDEGRAA